MRHEAHFDSPISNRDEWVRQRFFGNTGFVNGRSLRIHGEGVEGVQRSFSNIQEDNAAISVA